MGALEPELLGSMLDDAAAEVRLHAARLAEPLAGSSRELARKLCSLADDPDLRVRYQAAFSLGELPGDEATAALARIYQRDGDDPWMRLAVLSSAKGRSHTLAMLLVEQIGNQGRNGPEVRPTVERAARIVEPLAVLVAREGSQTQIAQLVAALRKLPEEGRAVADAALGGLVAGLGGARAGRLAQLRAASPEVDRALAELARSAEATALDERATPPQRAAALATLGLVGPGELIPRLEPLVHHLQPSEVQLAALRALDAVGSERLLGVVIERWSSLSPAVRREALEVVLARRQRIEPALEAIQSEALPLGQIDPARLKQLAEHQSASVRRRTARLLEALKLPRREAVVAEYRDVLKLPGDAERGRAAFRKTCSACHQLEGVGKVVGPDLAAIRNRGAEAILLAVLDPNREVNPQYASYVAATDDGRTLTGTIAAETATSITLRRAEGAEDTLLRSQIEALKSTGLSLMPEGIERELSRQDLADLVAYLMALP
jgi:putative heme-binding domain-containing protein